MVNTTSKINYCVTSVARLNSHDCTRILEVLEMPTWDYFNEYVYG